MAFIKCSSRGKLSADKQALLRNVDPEEAKRLKECFDRIDADKDGSVSKKE